MDSPPTKVRKRTREACEPCRRKKNRCPGEKPVCSYCARLNLSCSYAPVVHSLPLSAGTPDVSSLSAVADYSFVGVNRHQDDKINDIDDKLNEVLDHVRLLTAARPPIDRVETEKDQTSSQQINPSDLPTPDLFHKAAELFLEYCHCQPLPLFLPTSFVSTFSSRDLELRLCVAGLALRFDVDVRFRPGQSSYQDVYSSVAKGILMRKVTQGPVNLSTLQCLCLLALSDFNTGRQQYSGVYLSLASELARSARLDLFCRSASASVQHEEHVRCLWSIIMLQYLSGGFGPMSVQIGTSSLRYPISDATNVIASTARQSSGVTQDTDDDLGIVVYGLQMTEAWHKVRHYVQQRGKIDEHPPWSGQSIYSSIMCRQMEIESQMPHKHRFRPSCFSDHTAADLSANRLYWAPWLYLQIVYHATVCALNHPILLSIHLRRFRVNQVPELFLQRTADLISTHTDWIIHLLELAEEKAYNFTDPFLGQCVAIVATIFLQQSYTQDQEIRREKHERFLTCLRFVQNLGVHWSYVNQMAKDLQRFEMTLSRAYQSSLKDNSPNLSNVVDLAVFWKILDNTLPRSPASKSDNIFGSSLQLKIPQTAEGEILSTHMLPEPTRVHSVAQVHASAANTPATRKFTGISRNGSFHVTDQQMHNGMGSVAENFLDTPFLAQNFFALGQDFVGNANDWFN